MNYLMINAVGTYAAVCLSKLNRLKAKLIEYRQLCCTDLQAEIETVSFMEQVSLRLREAKSGKPNLTDYSPRKMPKVNLTPSINFSNGIY